MNVPVPKDFAPARVGMDGAGIGMSSGCLPAMHFLLRARRPYGLLKNMIAVAWIHRIVAISVKNDSRDSRPVTYLVIGPVGIERGNAGMGTFYRSKHELVFVFKNGDAAHTNTFELGQHGRYRTNVWEYAGANTFRAGRLDELAMHPTVKPVAMLADAIRDVTKRGAIVLDPFAGSG